MSNPPIPVLLHHVGGQRPAFSGRRPAAGWWRLLINMVSSWSKPQRATDCWDYASPQALTRDGGGETHGIAQMVRFAITTIRQMRIGFM